MSEIPSLYDWAGGDAAFTRLINAFYDRVENDELIAPFFPGGVSAEHRAHVIAWWVEAFGGAQDYTEKYGGHHHMINRHANLAITDEQRFRFASLMSQAADDAQLPSDPEFRAAFVGYVEWGTRLAVINSTPGANLDYRAPVKLWGWGVAPPYVPGA